MKASTTKLSLDWLRAHGYTAEVVEQWKRNPVTGQATRSDLFGIFDLVALRGTETVGVQTTTKAELPKRIRKIAAAPTTPALREAGWVIQCHGWFQPNGPRTRYEVEVVDL